MKKPSESESRALVPVGALVVEEKKPVTITITLSHQQHRVFTELAEHLEANVTASEMLTALACSALEMNPMIDDAGLAHLELSYRVLRARTGVVKVHNEWPVSAQEEVAS